MNISWDWITGLDPMVRDAFIIIMGFAVAFAVIKLWKAHAKAKEDLMYKYNTLNVLVFYLCKEHERNTGVKLIKEGANSTGDFGVNHKV